MSADVPAVRAGLDALGPFRLLSALGVAHRREGRMARFRCVWHSERTPSATLAVGPQGSLRAHCFGCERTGDALALVAAVRGYDERGDFPRVVEEAAELANVRLEASEPGTWAPRPTRPVEPPSEPERPLPPAGEADAAWEACEPVYGHEDAAAYLRGRAIDPYRADAVDVVRALPATGALPSWVARWRDGGFRLVVPTHDASGAIVSLRAWRIDGAEPKRVAPGGFRASGLVLADVGARAMLRGEWRPRRVVISEGEPDWAVWATRVSDADADAPAVLGLTGSGSWSGDVAARIPDGAEVYVRTDLDEPGERYAEAIASSLGSRVRLFRLRGAA